MCIARNSRGSLEVAKTSGTATERIVVHDPADPDPSLAFALSRITDKTPIGVFRAVNRPSYDDEIRRQLRVSAGFKTNTDDDVQRLLEGKDCWIVN